MRCSGDSTRTSDRSNSKVLRSAPLPRQPATSMAWTTSTIWYAHDDGPWAGRPAEIGRQHGVDLWAGIRWQKQFRDLPPAPPEHAAWTLDADGSAAQEMEGSGCATSTW
jgi:hypothetical protein